MATLEQLTAAAQDTVEQLMLVDAMDEAGRWEESAWLRLEAHRRLPAIRLSTGCPDVVSTTASLHVFGDPPRGRRHWYWTRADGRWAVIDDGRGTWEHAGPPPWVRRAVEDAAALAVAQALEAKWH